MRLAIAIAIVVTSTSARAAPLGQLSDVHAQLDCAACHDTGSAIASPVKCLACHKAIATSRGLHASPLVADTTCGTCHPDHLGRAADISGWPKVGGVNAFDHADTGWRLVGTHTSAACSSCHVARDTKGATRFTGLAAVCSSCHATPHGTAGFYQRRCETCHAQDARSMKAIRVDHSSFPLGKHVRPRVGCEGCHTPMRGSGKADITCEHCHATPPPPHGERFKGRACTDCHRVGTSWSPNAFDHSTTKFRLSFRHATITCRACHRGRGPSDFERFPDDTKCKGCHAHRLVHADPDHPSGRFRDDDCVKCHLIPGPPPRRGELLNLTHGVNGSFPLIKGHRSVPCTQCHSSTGDKGELRFDHVDTNCNGQRCHDGDPHRGKLGQSCESCHVGGMWNALKFDHDKPFRSGRTFPLRGAHQTQSCDGCHSDRDFAAAPATCVGCHAGDDAHRGSLGTRCERCHRDTGDITFDHDRASFKLDGKHTSVACIDCHPKGLLEPRPRACAGCHPIPAFHRNARTELAWYDDDCGGCHSTRRW